MFLAAFAGAALSALGMGGGGILILYLTLVAGMDQLAAQGINLVFFLPVAAVALLFHAKNKLVKWRVVLPCVALGLPGVWLGAKLAEYCGSELLSKLFGGFLLVIGIKELFSKKTAKKNS